MKYFKDLEHNDYQNILDEESGDNQTTDTATQNVEDVEESLEVRRYAIRNLVWFVKLGSLDKSKRNTTLAIIAFNVIFILVAGAVIAVKCSQSNQDEETKFDVGSVRLPIMLFDQNHPKIRQFKGILEAKTRKNKSNSTQTIKVDTEFVFAVKGKAEIDPDAWDTTRLYLQRKVYKDKQISVERMGKGDIVEISDDDCVVLQNLAKDSNLTTYMDYVTLENKQLGNTTAARQVEGEDGQVTDKEGEKTIEVNEGSEQEQKPIVKKAKITLNADESGEDSEDKLSVEKISEKGEQERKTVDKKEKSTSDSEEDTEEMSSEEFNMEEVEEDIADLMAYIA